MAIAAPFPDNTCVAKRDEAGLKNSIYDQQTRSGRRLSRGRLLLFKTGLPLVSALLRLAWGWTRMVRTLNPEHVADALSRAPSFIPVYWHQHQLLCSKYLFGVAGMKLGLLISPSVDGEFGAMLVRHFGGEVIRGSSTHTGARALRDFYQALVHEGISPVIAADGPKGPPWKFKPGAVLLSQLSQRPMIPLSFCASGVWKVGWDRFIIPKPFSRAIIAVGEPVYVPKGLDAAGVAKIQAEMEERLKNLFESARNALASRP